MQWSQLKKRIEATFADAVHGRVELWVTRYRTAPDLPGEAWITFDKMRLISMGSATYEAETAKIRVQLTDEVQMTDGLAPGQDEVNASVADEVNKSVQQQGIYPLWDVYEVLNDYLNLSIDDILDSDNSLIKALGMLDRRFGKRRLRAFDVRSEGPLVKKLYECRCLCEGIKCSIAPPGSDAQDGQSA